MSVCVCVCVSSVECPIDRAEMIDKCGAALSFIKAALIYRTSRVLYEPDDYLSARV